MIPSLSHVIGHYLHSHMSSIVSFTLTWMEMLPLLSRGQGHFTCARVLPFLSRVEILPSMLWWGYHLHFHMYRTWFSLLHVQGCYFYSHMIKAHYLFILGRYLHSCLQGHCHTLLHVHKQYLYSHMYRVTTFLIQVQGHYVYSHMYGDVTFTLICTETTFTLTCTRILTLLSHVQKRYLYCHIYGSVNFISTRTESSPLLSHVQGQYFHSKSCKTFH